MNIISTKYNFREASFEIFVAGCVGNNGMHCHNCFNPSTWDVTAGEQFSVVKNRISETILDSSEMIKSIRIYGGELLEKQLFEILDLLDFCLIFKKELWLFTRFNFEDVPQ